MDNNVKKQQHEQARKKHKHDAEAHARDLARQKPSYTAAWVLGIGLLLMIGIVVAVMFL